MPEKISLKKKDILQAVTDAGFVKCETCGTWHFEHEEHTCVFRKFKKKKKKKKPNGQEFVTNKDCVLFKYPLKKLEDIEKVKRFILVSKKSPVKERNYCFFIWGINSNLRGTDLIDITMDDLGVCGKGKGIYIPDNDYFTIREKKTGKLRRVYVNNAMKDALKAWVKQRGTHSGYLFSQVKGDKSAAVSLEYFRFYLRDVGLHLGVGLGLRVMRKTWAYWAWKKGGLPIEVISEAMNHSSPAVTRRYLGIDTEEVKEAFMVEI
jgi:integrase